MDTPWPVTDYWGPHSEEWALDKTLCMHLVLCIAAHCNLISAPARLQQKSCQSGFRVAMVVVGSSPFTVEVGT